MYVVVLPGLLIGPSESFYPHRVINRKDLDIKKIAEFGIRNCSSSVEEAEETTFRLPHADCACFSAYTTVSMQK